MLPHENVHKQLPYLFAQSTFRGHLLRLENLNICYLIHPLLQDYHNTLLSYELQYQQKLAIAVSRKSELLNELNKSKLKERKKQNAPVIRLHLSPQSHR
jgi:hypothetical protein